MRESAGTLLYRAADGGWQVLIVHPSGNFNRQAPWSIPKGEPNPGETPEATARRETYEETGVIAGELIAIGETVLKKSRKRIQAFAGPAPADAVPTCASWEVDRAEFVPVDLARERLHPDQAIFIDHLIALLSSAGAGPES